MKDKLAEKLKETLIKIGNKSHIDLSDIRVELKENKDKDFGDFSSNAAMVCAKRLSLTPIDLAKDIIENLKGIEEIEKLEIAGPGFINFFVTNTSRFKVLEDIFLEGDEYGINTKKRSRKDLN